MDLATASTTVSRKTMETATASATVSRNSLETAKIYNVARAFAMAIATTRPRLLVDSNSPSCTLSQNNSLLNAPNQLLSIRVLLLLPCAKTTHFSTCHAAWSKSGSRMSRLLCWGNCRQNTPPRHSPFDGKPDLPTIACVRLRLST